MRLFSGAPVTRLFGKKKGERQVWWINQLTVPTN